MYRRFHLSGMDGWNGALTTIGTPGGVDSRHLLMQDLAVLVVSLLFFARPQNVPDEEGPHSRVQHGAHQNRARVAVAKHSSTGRKTKCFEYHCLIQDFPSTKCESFTSNHSALLSSAVDDKLQSQLNSISTDE
ncbi:hypothetical protein CEXT_627711 [Caerostris extrusa]|uniref:Uncharacterized protein n=1 Tax=Caerostris extrusa TaxID=172846 RepID=A0AAV4XWK8_CAEEX|nr:hypothetical protein CEXT_627711 [Caerostris extrusa]